MGSKTIETEEMDEIIINMMFNLLKRYYPIRRIKHKTRFKRGVDINGHTFLIPKDNYVIFGNLFSELGTLYSAKDSEIKHVLTKFYSIKD
tara:strand:- start:1206 stop:1475 length:270 start_codon:yes stop_codon:yes gene_type:complete